MTLDEAITHALDEAEKHGRQAKKISGINMYQSGKLYQCAREHAQLAEWLMELKAYRETYPYGVDRYNGQDEPQTDCL